ncbi:hypothetical protein QNO07_00620 [Streptomyces sp. 549]|uniref:hypothetical protein n=1 Tax=Streptomyces sp. 549 TaxID=3049076 RepID=UPI0024C45C08|nr:hypothetical protein [Streptomyces sp. 549]MDK1471941.1 hypothetical protein [Streptomyces sp. 549]
MSHSYTAAEKGGQETKMLRIYLNDHLTAATASVELAHRLRDGHTETAMAVDLERLAAEAEQDRAALLAVMRSLGVPVSRPRLVAAWLGERAGRLKTNGRLTTSSPLRTVVELEGMLLAVQARILLWRLLAGLADAPGRLDADRLEELRFRAEAQVDLLERLRLRAADEVFRPAPAV